MGLLPNRDSEEMRHGQSELHSRKDLCGGHFLIFLSLAERTLMAEM